MIKRGNFKKLLGKCRPQRNKSLPQAMNGFLVTERIQSENSFGPKSPILNECLDKNMTEFERRFSNETLNYGQQWNACRQIPKTF